MFDFLSSPVKKGIELIQQRQYTQAIEFFTQLIKEKPSIPEAHLYLGKCYFFMEHYTKARESLHNALNLKASPQVISSLLEITNWKMVAPCGYFNSFPTFSADGKMLAYVSARTDTNGDFMINSLDKGGIYITYLDSGKEVRVVPEEYMNSFPAFSPDGKKLVYLSGRSEGSTEGMDNPALYLMDLETGQETKLMDETNKIKYPSFSPDGKKIIFACWRRGYHNSGVFAFHLGPMKLETISSGMYYEHAFPSISPVEEKVLYTSWRRDTNGDKTIDIRDNSGIYLKDLAQGLENSVLSDEYNNLFPTFSPDGTKIVFLSSRRDTNKDGKIDSFDNSGIYLYDLNRKSETCLVDDVFYNKFPSFITNDKKIVFISNARTPTEEHQTRGYFEFKGIYAVEFGSKDARKLVSEELWGSRSLVVSPKGNMAAYVSWHHESARGLFVAYLDRLPSAEELHQWIDQNIQEPAPM
ncbi:MAG: TolB family protein [Endomicrobiales bacterium]